MPAIDLAPLRSLSEGTFGRAYARHMDEHQLAPLTIHADVAEELAPFALGLRYSMTHDMFHVLLGYDVSWAGEMGVWSFVGSQRYSRQFEWAATLARTLYPLWAPQQRHAIRACDRRSQQLATQAPCLIACALSRHWDEPLNDVRLRFNLLMP